MPNIKTFCRIKPTEETYEEHEASRKTLYLRVPEVLKDFNSNSKGSRTCVNHEFNFDHIFMQDATQQNVFDVAALDIVTGKSPISKGNIWLLDWGMSVGSRDKQFLL